MPRAFRNRFSQYVPHFDPYSVLVYSAHAGNVRDVFIAGEQVVSDKKLVHFDVTQLRKELTEAIEQSGFKRKAQSQS